MRDVHLHVVRPGVDGVLRAARLQRAPVEVDHLEDVRTLEWSPEEQRSLHLVVQGVLDCTVGWMDSERESWRNKNN